MNNAKILALDISSVSSGWSIFENMNLVAHGVIRPKRKASHGEKLTYFEEEVSSLIEEYQPNYFVAEEVFVGRNPKVFKILSLYHGVAYKLCYTALSDIPYIMYEGEVRQIIGDHFNATLKEKGKKDKELTFEFINSHYSLDFEFKKHNDITDAIAVGLSFSILLDEGVEKVIEYQGYARKKRKKAKKAPKKKGKKK